MKTKDKDRYTFSSVCHKLSERKYDKGKAPEDIKLLVELAECFFTGSAAAAVATAGAPSVAGAFTFATVIKTISEKGKVLDAAKRIMELLSKDDPSYEGKYERMQEAYAILWVASFFDAFERTVPKDILTDIALAANEKAAIAGPICLFGRLENANSESIFPNMVFGTKHVYDRLESVYKEMTGRLREFINKLAFSEGADERKQRTLDTKLEELPGAALSVFMDQYLTLCSKFPEFAAYINLEKEREYKFEVDAQNSALVDLIIKSQEEAAQNFQTLEDAICHLYTKQREGEVKRIADRIEERYKKAITRPIVETEATEAPEELNYPTITEAFVPQQYRLLEYTSKDMRLEMESQWVDYEPRKDMLAFWGRFLLDPQSISHLVLILGEPGGGKSLLTEMISAKIISDAELVVRIPLRRYSSKISYADNSEIEDMICQQIKDDGDAARKFESFKEFVGDAPERPTTLIFDGYDEIQQATGLAYPGFLKRLYDYQRHCLEENRPVRIVVTSRRTLIDKAIIPIGTVVMKLLPFEPYQKVQWIETWNQYNHEKLRNAGLADFRLPEGSREVDELSSQPLLLLMLAIYDADFETRRNALEAQAEGFNRMRLYDDLIRRFIRRELRKDWKEKKPLFDDDEEKKQKKLVDEEMEKLGIAALGMFVRRRLWITVPELKADFSKLEAKRKSFSDERALEAEEIFLGSFFFIHDSRNRESTNTEAEYRKNNHEEDASFVFLHKTFYEFLAADYVLNAVFQYAIELSNAKKYVKSFYAGNLVSFEQMPPQFYMSLNSAPLCTEPEIASMISEWGSQKAINLLEDQGSVFKKDLLEVIDDMITKHTECIRKGEMNPSIELSLLQHQPVSQRKALYILNLVTVRTLLNDRAWETGLETWRFLAQYVKLYACAHVDSSVSDLSQKIGFDTSEELLFRFMAIFQINIIEDGHVAIKKRDKLMELADRNPLDARVEVFRFLQDNISELIYSLHSIQKSFDEKQKMFIELAKYDTTLCLERETAMIQASLLCENVQNRKSLAQYLFSFGKLLRDEWRDASIVFRWLICFRRLADNGLFDLSRDREISDSIEYVTSRLIERLINTDSREWEHVLLLWLDIIRNELSGIDNQVLSRSFMDLLLRDRIPWLSDNAIYEIAKHITAFYNEPMEHSIYYDSDSSGVIEHYTYRGSGRYIKPNIFSDRGGRYFEHYIEKLIWNGHIDSYQCSPKRVASILMLARCLFNKDSEWVNKVRLIHIDLSRYLNNSRMWWEELPCLLWEYVALGEIDNVRDLLSDVNIELNLLSSTTILEYIALADAVWAEEFLQKVFGLTKLRLRDCPDCCCAFTHAACSLLDHEKVDNFNDLTEVVNNYEMYSLILEKDPVGATRLLTLLDRIDKKYFNKRSKFMCLRSTLDHIGMIFQRSPQTAIEFLRQYMPLLRAHSSTLQLDYVIRDLLLRARLNDRREETDHLNKLLRSLHLKSRENLRK